MSLTISERHKWVLQSEIRNMSIECDRLGGINLSQGVCDLEVPLQVREAAKQAIDDGVNCYTRFDGLEEIRKAIAFKQLQFSGLEVDPESEVVVSAGATGALYCACLGLLNPGDEVLLFEPFYGYHVTTLVASGAKPVYVRMTPPAWEFSVEDLERAVTDKTRAILVNTPGNPSGKVFSRSEIDAIFDFAKRRDLFVFTDEIYEHFVYGEAEHVSPTVREDWRDRVVMVSGLSKTFSITGWRIGYSICGSRWAQAIGHFNDLIYVCAPAPLQMGVAKGLMSLPKGYYTAVSDDYGKKRDLVCGALETIGLTPVVPQGAYYIFADVRRLPGETGKEKAMFLLEKTGIATVPGEAFYHDGYGNEYVRICFAKNDDVLERAALVLVEKLKGY